MFASGYHTWGYFKEQVRRNDPGEIAGVAVPEAAEDNEEVHGRRTDEAQRKREAELLYQNLAGKLGAGEANVPSCDLD